MDPLTLALVSRALDADEPLPAERPLPATGACIDTRALKPGDLFFALPGEHTDGHRFLETARLAGAAAAVVRRGSPIPPLGGPLPLLVVEDPRAALGRLASFVRGRLTATVIGITGSNGKTTTKDLVGAAAATLGPTVRSERSYNNDLGVPLTILRADGGTRTLVVEIGTSRPGEVAALAAIARPHVGIVTNVGEAHLGHFGSLRAIAEEKAALLAALPEDGAAIVNAEDPFAPLLASRARCRVCTFGRWNPGEGESPDVWATRAGRRRPRGTTFWLYGKMPFGLALEGLHNVSNALAALAAGMLLGGDPGRLRDALRAVRNPRMRLSRESVGGVTLIDDSYNANPASVEAALEELSATVTDGRRVFVFGDMRELGDAAEQQHRRIGRRAAACADFVWAVGEQARHAVAAALDAGLPRDRVLCSPSVEFALEGPAFLPSPGDVVLLKGSRAAELDRLASALRSRLAAGEAKAGGEGRREAV